MADAQWMDIDVGTLSAEAQAAYSEYKDAQRKAAALREMFEQTAVAGMTMPQGKRMVFGYRFGKLSAALVDDDRKTSKPKQAKGSLSDFLASQGANGHAV